MFYIRKPTQEKNIIIRTATAADLSNYKKNKGLLDDCEDDVNNKVPSNNCSCNNKFELEDFFANEYFFINCELNASEMKEKD